MNFKKWRDLLGGFRNANECALIKYSVRNTVHSPKVRLQRCAGGKEGKQREKVSE